MTISSWKRLLLQERRTLSPAIRTSENLGEYESVKIRLPVEFLRELGE